MRYIDLDAVIDAIPPECSENLREEDESMSNKSDEEKVHAARNGGRMWSPVRACLEDASNSKCWYTESKNPGCQNDIDHFRPKARAFEDNELAHWYWFLVFNPINYRISSQFSNRLHGNPVMDLTGGKGNKFPLMPGSLRATNVAELANESPVILDPCNEADAELLVFQADGRPVVSQRHSDDAAAVFRVERSKLLLNLDFPTFNEDREDLYNRIKCLVERGDRYVGNSVDALEDVQDDLRELMQRDAQYSKAAECYIRCFRDRGWVEEIVLRGG